MENLSQFVGSKIRHYRKMKKMTQQELGKRIGVKHNTISAYEVGRISPEQDMLFALAQELDITVDDLFPPVHGDNLLDRAARMKEHNLDLSDMAYLQQLMTKVESMDSETREKFMHSIRFAVEFFEKQQNQD